MTTSKILRVLRIILVIWPEHQSDTKSIHNDDGNPSRANIKQALRSRILFRGNGECRMSDINETQEIDLGDNQIDSVYKVQIEGLLDVVGDWLPDAEHRKCTRQMDMRCATFENGISESFNRAILGPRHKPIITMLEKIRLYIMRRLVAMNKIAFGLEDRITPSIRKSGGRGDGSGGSGGGMGGITGRGCGNTSRGGGNTIKGGGNTRKGGGTNKCGGTSSRGGRSRRGGRMARTFTSDGHLTTKEEYQLELDEQDFREVMEE
ncbi:hypothetical protein Tco_0936549 [Tanacetum coccineum]